MRLGGGCSEIFTVTWFPGDGEEGEGRRMITDARAVVGELSPVKTPKSKSLNEKGVKSRIAKGRVSKAKTRSKAS